MSRKMLINVLHPEEARIAIVQDGRLMELNIEISGKEQTKGNIYKGVVLRVEPGLQAAFIDIGQKKPGFIQMGDLHPDNWQWRDDIPETERKRRPRIQEVLRRGQELIVQVEKDARDMKGAALTSYISLPGRYMVLMPGDDAAGISRKIEDNAIRKELKALVAELKVPSGYGYIVRTEAVGRTIDELKKDLEYLTGVHERILKQAESIKGAGEIYQDAGVILRTIRDYFSDDIDEVLVDDKAACQQAIEFFREIMPGCEKLVKLHKEKRPIFSKFQLEEQIDQLYEKRVPLPSGGSLVIEPTEALVSIDVNSGKSSGEKGVEDTAFKTNLEAAAEVARQLRLRDLGGLVMIDFIDMRDNKHNKEVERALKEALKMDKARVNLGRISQFGIMEMSRQRIAKNINDAIHLECPHCEGRGRVKSVEAMSLSFLRKVHAAAAKGQIAEVRGGLPLEVAYFLLNRKKRELAQIENDYEIVVTVKGKPSFMLNQLELETVRKEKQRDETQDESVPQFFAEIQEESDVAEQSDTAEQSVPEQTENIAASSASATKKRRKRKRKKKASEQSPDAVETETVSEVSDEAVNDSLNGNQEPETSVSAGLEDSHSETVSEQEVQPETLQQAVPKKRKRSRVRKKPVSVTDTEIPAVVTSAVSAEVAETVLQQEQEAESVPPEESRPAATKKSRPRGRRSKKTESTVEASGTEALAEESAGKAAEQKPSEILNEAEDTVAAETVAGGEPEQAPKPRKRAAARKKKLPVATETANEE